MMGCIDCTPTPFAHLPTTAQTAARPPQRLLCQPRVACLT
jgi:hypothetical protein